MSNEKRALGWLGYIGDEILASYMGIINKLGGGFKSCLFSPLFGEMIQFDSYFSSGLKPPTR